MGSEIILDFDHKFSIKSREPKGGMSEVCGFAVRGDFLCGFSVCQKF